MLPFNSVNFHKTANVLNKLPKSLQGKAKGHLQDARPHYFLCIADAERARRTRLMNSAR